MEVCKFCRSEIKIMQTSRVCLYHGILGKEEVIEVSREKVSKQRSGVKNIL